MIADTPKKVKIPGKVTQDYLEKAAFNYLGTYASSSENLRRVLMRKVKRRCILRGEDAQAFIDLVDLVVAKVLRIGLIDDRAYAEIRVATLRRKGGSSRLIEQKLVSKGLDREQIRSVLADTEGDDMQAARRLIRRRKLGSYRGPGRTQFRDKDIAVLARAGFSLQIAITAVDEDWDPMQEEQ